MLGATLAGALVGALVLGAVAALAGIAWLGVLLGAALAAVAVTWVVRTTPSRVLGAVGARPNPAGEQPRLRNLVDGLCVSNGLPVPQLSAVSSPGLNCMAVGRTPDHTTLVVTDAMLEQLDRIELEGVVARQLAQVKHGQVHLATVLVPLAAVAPGLVARALPDRYDLRADLEAVVLTRYPPGLAAALDKARVAGGDAPATRSTSHLWFADPSPSGGESPVIAHSPIDERIETLQEL